MTTCQGQAEFLSQTCTCLRSCMSPSAAAVAMSSSTPSPNDASAMVAAGVVAAAGWHTVRESQGHRRPGWSPCCCSPVLHCITGSLKTGLVGARQVRTLLHALTAISSDSVGTIHPRDAETLAALRSVVSKQLGPHLTAFHALGRTASGSSWLLAQCAALGCQRGLLPSATRAGQLQVAKRRRRRSVPRQPPSHLAAGR